MKESYRVGGKECSLESIHVHLEINCEVSEISDIETQIGILNKTSIIYLLTEMAEIALKNGDVNKENDMYDFKSVIIMLRKWLEAPECLAKKEEVILGELYRKTLTYSLKRNLFVCCCYIKRATSFIFSGQDYWYYQQSENVEYGLLFGKLIVNHLKSSKHLFMV